MENEKVLFDEQVIWYRYKLQAIVGRLVIKDKTISFNRHIVEPYNKHPITLALHKLRLKQIKNGFVFESELSKVKLYKGKKMGPKTYILEVIIEGDKTYKFMFGDEYRQKIEPIISITEK